MSCRRSPGAVTYRDRIYVVGGMGEKEDLSSVEVSNAEQGGAFMIVGQGWSQSEKTLHKRSFSEGLRKTPQCTPFCVMVTESLNQKFFVNFWD